MKYNLLHTVLQYKNSILHTKILVNNTFTTILKLSICKLKLKLKVFTKVKKKTILNNLLKMLALSMLLQCSLSSLN